MGEALRTIIEGNKGMGRALAGAADTARRGTPSNSPRSNRTLMPGIPGHMRGNPGSVMNRGFTPAPNPQQQKQIDRTHGGGRRMVSGPPQRFPMRGKMGGY